MRFGRLAILHSFVYPHLAVDTMHIRAAIDGDAMAIAKVHVASWRVAYDGIVPNEVLDTFDAERRVRQWAENIAHDSIETIVAEAHGEIVGFASFGATRDNDADHNRVAEIQAIYVHPDSWGQRFGRRLCESAIAELVEQSYEQITLWVLKDNPRARRFYELAGFVLDGKTRTETIGVPLDVLRYRLTNRLEG